MLGLAFEKATANATASPSVAEAGVHGGIARGEEAGAGGAGVGYACQKSPVML